MVARWQSSSFAMWLGKSSTRELKENCSQRLVTVHYWSVPIYPFVMSRQPLLYSPPSNSFAASSPNITTGLVLVGAQACFEMKNCLLIYSAHTWFLIDSSVNIWTYRRLDSNFWSFVQWYQCYSAKVKTMCLASKSWDRVKYCRNWAAGNQSMSWFQWGLLLMKCWNVFSNPIKSDKLSMLMLHLILGIIF